MPRHATFSYDIYVDTPPVTLFATLMPIFRQRRQRYHATRVLLRHAAVDTP